MATWTGPGRIRLEDYVSLMLYINANMHAVPFSNPTPTLLLPTKALSPLRTSTLPRIHSPLRSPAARMRMLSGRLASCATRWKLNRMGRRRSIVTRAVILPRFGGPDVLEIRGDVEVPELKADEVLVRSRAVSVNPLDTRMRAGYGRSIFEPLLPLILGRDVSGEVAAVGASVRSLSIGQQVFGALHPTAARGTYTDYAILPESELTRKPENMSHVEASAVPFVALTAWRALKSTAKITEGQRVLILGGGGAVGFSAVQIAVAAGCHVATTCGVESIDLVLEAGAEQAIDYMSEDIESSIKGKFDAVLDTIGGPDTETLGTNFLFKGGHYMTLQGESASYADSYGLIVGLPLATAVLAKKQLQYRMSHGIDYSWVYMRADPEGLQEIRRLCEDGKFKIPVEKTYPITHVREAHQAKDKRLVIGKVVLEVDCDQQSKYSFFV